MMSRRFPSLHASGANPRTLVPSLTRSVVGETIVGGLGTTSDVDVIWIAIGGAIGSVGRYAVARGVHTWLPPTWPYGTLVVNVLGCAVIGRWAR